MKRQTLTFSRINSFCQCPRRHYFAYELGLRPRKESAPLRIGSAVHLGLDWLSFGLTMDQVLAELLDHDIDAFELASVQAMLAGYSTVWPDVSKGVVHSELTFGVPLPGSRKWQLCGTIDKIVKHGDAFKVREHKTTSDMLCAEGDYWRRLRFDAQIGIYLYAARHMGFDCVGVEYDVIRKPGIRPLQVNKRRDREESPVEYGERCLANLMEVPSENFARREFTRTTDEIAALLKEVKQQADAIATCQKRRGWPRTSTACVGMFRCPYLDICETGMGVGDIHEAPMGFEFKDPFEELRKEKNNGKPTSTQAVGNTADAASDAIGGTADNRPDSEVRQDGAEGVPVANRN